MNFYRLTQNLSGGGLKDKKIWFVLLFSIVFGCFLFFGLAGQAWGATLYVDGTAGACTSNYSIANRNCTGSDGNSYAGLVEVSTVYSANDTIRVRAGTYTPATSATFANKVTLTSYGYTGPGTGEIVTIIPPANHALIITGASSTIAGLTFSGGGAAGMQAVRVRADNVTVSDINCTNITGACVGNSNSATGGIANRIKGIGISENLFYILTGSFTANYSSCYDCGAIIINSPSTATFTLNNSEIIGTTGTTNLIVNASGATLTTNNLIILNSGITGAYTYVNSGIYTDNNSIITGPPINPWLIKSDSGTSTFNNPLYNAFPHFVNPGKNVAIATFYAVDNDHFPYADADSRCDIDDPNNVYEVNGGSIPGDYCYGGACYFYNKAADQAGIHITLFTDDTAVTPAGGTKSDLDNRDKAALAYFLSKGHEIAQEGSSASPLSGAAPMGVLYSGFDANPQIVISGICAKGGTNDCTLSATTNGADSLGSFDISQNGAYKFVGDQLCPWAVSGTGGLQQPSKHWSCGIYGFGNASCTAAGKPLTCCTGSGTGTCVSEGDYDDSYSNGLATATYNLTSGTAHDISWDLTSNGKYLTQEINNSTLGLEQIVRGLSGVANTALYGNHDFDSWTPSSYFYARYKYNSTARTMIVAAGFTSALSTAGTAWVDLASISDLWSLSDIGTYTTWANMQGAGYAALDAAGKEARIRGSARSVAWYLLRYGKWMPFLLPESGTSDNGDQLYWFADELKKSGVLVLSFAEAADYINANYSCTDGACTKTLTQTYDVHLLPTSPLIDAGTPISGLTTDYEGNPIYGTPDIGAYEYQPPHTMGTDKIDIGAGARIYSDGKFRDVNATSGVSANLSITPSSGSFTVYGSSSTPRNAYLDVSVSTWSSTEKTWTESNASSGITNTLHTVADLTPNKYYSIAIDGADAATKITGANCGLLNSREVCQANSSGQITFTYIGSYSTHTFDISQTSGPAVAVSDSGGMPSAWYNPPQAPVGGFSISINNGNQITTNSNVILNLKGGPDTARMAISNTPDFAGASQETYTASKPWNLCAGLSSCISGTYTVYAKFFAPWGTASNVVSDSIMLGNQTSSGQIPSAGSTSSPQASSGQATQTFTKDLKFGNINTDVKRLQIFLNQDPDVQVAKSGVGSTGNETNFFGYLTRAAVIKFQEKYAEEILTPWGLVKGTGFVGKTTRAKINQLIK